MGALKERVLKNMEKRRNNILNGNINCFPSKFTRFKKDFVGVEQGKYYVVTAAQKCGKTQFASNVFIYEPLLYCFHNPDKASIKVFYYNLEESEDDAFMRFITFILYRFGQHRVSMDTLKSTDGSMLLPEEVLDMLSQEPYASILDYFEDHVEFMESRNPTGCYKDLKRYADEHGVTHYTEREITDKNTGNKVKVKKFDYYEPYNPKEYVIIFWDHASLIESERGWVDKKQLIDKLSEYFVTFRNDYNYTPVLLQQQSSETQSLEAFKLKKIRASLMGLADSKYTGRDCSLCIGLTNPNAYALPDCYGYDITKLKGNFRLAEVLANRHGPTGGMVGLFYDGCVCNWQEMPKSNDLAGIAKVYSYINSINP